MFGLELKLKELKAKSCYDSRGLVIGVPTHIIVVSV
jgi:hypothetical protein